MSGVALISLAGFRQSNPLFLIDTVVEKLQLLSFPLKVIQWQHLYFEHITQWIIMSFIVADDLWGSIADHWVLGHLHLSEDSRWLQTFTTTDAAVKHSEFKKCFISLSFFMSRYRGGPQRETWLPWFGPCVELQWELWELNVRVRPFHFYKSWTLRLFQF